MKFTPLNDTLAAYVNQHHAHAGDTLLHELAQETHQQFGSAAGMQIGADQGAFMTMLAKTANVKTAVEVGTFTGHSSICIARALPEDGHLHCFDASEEYTDVARKYWQRAGLDDRITLTLGPAADKLQKWVSEPREKGWGADFVFIDADKTGYDTYYELILPHVRPGGLILFDNMLWDGKVTDNSYQDKDTNAIRALNTKLTADPRVTAALLSIGDGIHLCTKR